MMHMRYEKSIQLILFSMWKTHRNEISIFVVFLARIPAHFKTKPYHKKSWTKSKIFMWLKHDNNYQRLFRHQNFAIVCIVFSNRKLWNFFFNLNTLRFFFSLSGLSTIIRRFIAQFHFTWGEMLFLLSSFVLVCFRFMRKFMRTWYESFMLTELYQFHINIST